jgi:hypothetical protein
MEVIEYPRFRATLEWAHRILQDLPDHIMEVCWLVGAPRLWHHENEAVILVLEGCLDVLSAETPHTRMKPGALAVIGAGERYIARPHGCARILTIAEPARADASADVIGPQWTERQSKGLSNVFEGLYSHGSLCASPPWRWPWQLLPVTARHR